MISKSIHIHKNIVDRKRNLFLLFLPTIIFVLFLTIMFSYYKTKEFSNDNYETTLGDKENIDNGVDFNAQ